ncbi:MAG: aldose epimerase family protein [Gammaproteobacteria bacterium]|jgi:aldose 1-epimerase|nr:aldose epimerase family protein [Gammaproteobacteria bacterium]
MNEPSINLFGVMPDGQEVASITIAGGGLTATFLTYGAVLQDLRLEGHPGALVLGLNSLADYLNHSRYFGATAGRYANRIGHGQAVFGGVIYNLDRNFMGKHLLHGGQAGMGKKVWRIVDQTHHSVQLAIDTPDGDMGFPGNLAVNATFTLLDDGVLDIVYQATTDATTLCNLAHHSYFNLGDTDDVLDHKLQVDAEYYLPVDEELIPTGEKKSVAGTNFDYRYPQMLRHRVVDMPHDHNFCLAEQKTALRQVAQLSHATSGITMHVSTTEPGLQVYDGSLLDVPVLGLDQRPLGAYAGIAIEPQAWPDAPNNPHFPQALLRASERYRQHTQFKFNKEK